jgi:diguanylate cyclase (GGDEF)-like protein
VTVADLDAIPTMRWSRFRRPGVVAACVAALALPSVAYLVDVALRPVEAWALLAFCLAFFVAESLSLSIEVRSQTFQCSVGEVVLVVALVEMGGAWTAVAWAGAVFAINVRERIAAAKTLANVAMIVVQVGVVVLLLEHLPVTELTDPLTWLGYLAAILPAAAVGTVVIVAAITITQGYPGRAMLAPLFVPVLVVYPLSVVVGLAGALLVERTPWAWLLVLPVVIALGLLYRRFARVTRERETLQRVYQFARRVEQVGSDEDGTRRIVEAVRELLNAERVALWLPPYLDEEPRLVVASDDGDGWYEGPSDPDDLFRRRATEGGQDGPVLVSLGGATEAEAAALARRGARDLLAAPVATAAGEPGYLEICDRRSDVVSFADGDRAALDSMLTHVNAAIRQQQLLTQIRYDADHDRLTGLPNRQRLAVEIDQLLAADPVAGRAGLILASLDNYAEVTDTLGHAASDELLLVTAGLLREHAPPQALVARMEGEQFAVLLPGLSLPATERAARRLREATSTRARVAGLDLEVTLTIGVAAAPAHGADSGTNWSRRWPMATSESSSSRSSTPAAPTSSPSRRWSAGPTRATGRSRRTSSSTSRSRSAGSARSPTTCSTWRWPAVAGGWTRTSPCRWR